MVHPATRRAALTAVAALGVDVDVGVVFRPRPGEDRGRGVWQHRDLGVKDVAALLPRLAAANAAGAAVYMRLAPGLKGCHPGVILLDDLDSAKLDRLVADGFQPRLLVETSPGNIQVWICLSAGTVDYAKVHEAARLLSARYDADPRAVSPMQPGRLPGFTNRKPRYGIAGMYPFVRLLDAAPGVIASAGPALLAEMVGTAQRGGGGRAAPETPRIAATSPAVSAEVSERIDALAIRVRERILEQVRRGTRPATAASQSEIEFAIAAAALTAGIEPLNIEAWLAVRRPDKHSRYAARTVAGAIAWVTSQHRRATETHAGAQNGRSM